MASLYLLSALGWQHSDARALLEAYFELVADEHTQRQQPAALFTARLAAPDKKVLELIWALADAARPRNVPWDFEPAPPGEIPPEHDINDPAFYQLDRWTGMKRWRWC